MPSSPCPEAQSLPPAESSFGGLDRLTPESRGAFEANSRPVDAPAGSVLFAQGEPHTDTFLVGDGLVRTYYLAPNGKEITLAFWSRGNLIGGPDFFGAARHVWSAATVKASTLLAIEGETLRTLARRHFDLAEWIIETLSFKTRWSSLLFQSIATECVTNRLAHQLVRLSEMYGRPDEDGVAIAHEFTQEDLAGMIGATRQWVSTTLAELQRADLILLRNRRLVIRNPDELRNFDRSNAR